MAEDPKAIAVGENNKLAIFVCSNSWSHTVQTMAWLIPDSGAAGGSLLAVETHLRKSGQQLQFMSLNSCRVHTKVIKFSSFMEVGGKNLSSATARRLLVKTWHDDI